MARIPWVVGFFRNRFTLLLLLTVAAAIRIWTIPCRNELRDGDEIGYVSGGLVMWEGMLPGWRIAPAGPQTWIGWIWVATRSAWEFLHQPANTPAALKPFAAINQALFDTYGDLGPLRQFMLWISYGIALIGVLSGYRLALKYGGTAGALLIGGVIASLPLYVELSGYSKSYSDSWMLGIAAVSCAATFGARYWWLSGVLFGLSVASRVEMVTLAPLVIWGLWDSTAERLFSKTSKILFVSLITVIIVAPWLLIGFVGTLRAITMVRVMGYWHTESPILTMLKELTWVQGLGPVLLATLIGFFLIPAESRFKKLVLGVVSLLLVSTMFLGRSQAMRYNGAPLIAILVATAVGTGSIFNRLPKWTAASMAVCLLILPAIQSLRVAAVQRSLRHADYSAEWIEKHVPAGTRVYLHGTMICETVLPTPEAADAIWMQVADDQAWRTKLKDGLRRFSLSAEQLPRAMSEDNLCMDRAICRRWFILGGDSRSRPRYNVCPFDISATFGIHGNEVAEAFKRTGGVLIWKTAALEKLPTDFGEPFVKWVNSAGNGALVFVSDDIRGKLLN